MSYTNIHVGDRRGVHGSLVGRPKGKRPLEHLGVDSRII